MEFRSTMKGIIQFLILGLLPCIRASSLCTNAVNVTTMTSSSQMAPNDKTRNHGPDRSPLNTLETKDANGVTQMGAWVAEKNNFNEWIQLEMKDVSLIRGLITQGRNGCCKEWVSKYRVLYSEDCKTNWITLGDFNTTDKIFSGNSDQDTPVQQTFHCPIMAKCVRINPLGWNKNIAMRVGLLGCNINLNSSTQTTSTQSPTTVTSSTLLPSTTTKRSTTNQQSTVISKQTSTIISKIQSTQPNMASITATPQKQGPTQKTGLQSKCVKSCTGVGNGNYQSCQGCDMYVSCVWDRSYDKRLCPAGTKWDDIDKRCLFKSKTCP